MEKQGICPPYPAGVGAGPSTDRDVHVIHPSTYLPCLSTHAMTAWREETPKPKPPGPGADQQLEIDSSIGLSEFVVGFACGMHYLSS